jgi:hypothetical protein
MLKYWMAGGTSAAAAKDFSTALLGCGEAKAVAVVLSWSLIAAAVIVGQGILRSLVDVPSWRKKKLGLN